MISIPEGFRELQPGELLGPNVLVWLEDLGPGAWYQEPVVSHGETYTQAPVRKDGYWRPRVVSDTPIPSDRLQDTGAKWATEIPAHRWTIAKNKRFCAAVSRMGPAAFRRMRYLP